MSAGPAELAVSPVAVRRRMAVLFGVVFVDLLGLGILMPLIPFYGVRLGLSAEILTLVISLHALFQFIGAPLLGKLSDRIGRRPVLAFSMAGHAAAYLLLAVADSIWLLALSRIVSGFTSGNLSAAYAYASDLSTPEQRTSMLAKISAAFGLGLTVGPLLGGALAGPGDPANANLWAPALAAAALSVISWLSILWFLPESRNVSGAAKPRSDLTRRASVLNQPLVRLAAVLALVVITFSAVRETLFALWMHDKYGFDTAAIGGVIALHGLLVALVQFYGMQHLAERFGERRLVTAGIVCYAISWWGLAMSRDINAIYLSMAVSAIATAFFATSLQSLLTQRVHAEQRGAVLGALQSSSALARFIGAAVSGTLYGRLGVDAPFLLGALAMIPALLIGRSLLLRNTAASDLP